MDYLDLVRNAKPVQKSIFDLSDDDFKDNKLVLVDKQIVLGDTKGSRCLINKDGTYFCNSLGNRKIEKWMKEATNEDLNWVSNVAKAIKAFGVIIIDYR